MSAAACTGDRYGGRLYAGTPLGPIGASAPPPAPGNVSVPPFAPDAAPKPTRARAGGGAGRRVGREGGGDQRQQLRRDAAELRPALDDPEEDGLEVARAVRRAAGGGARPP